MTEKEKMLSGELYDASDPQLELDRLDARELLYDFNHSRPSKTTIQDGDVEKSCLVKTGQKYLYRTTFSMRLWFTTSR